MTDHLAAYDPTALPAPVTTYLEAHDRGDEAAAVSVFGPDAVVEDDGSTYRGVDEIRSWVGKSSSEYTYTSTPFGQQVDGPRVVVATRVVGNFPGGTVDLRYRFVLEDDRISALTIGI